MENPLTQKSIDFLWELSLNNERPWFQAHKEEFVKVLDKPFKALAQETLEFMRNHLPQRDLSLHVSRIYRDARRLFGRGPYQDNLWFSLQEGDAARQGPMFWFELNREGTSHGLGYWDRSARQGAVFRRMIDKDPAGFVQLAEGLPCRETARLWGDEYKRPKGSFGPVIDPWYNRKQASVGWENFFREALFTPELPRLLTDSFMGLLPMYDFFLEAYRIGRMEELEEEQNSLWGIAGGEHGE